MRDVLTVFDGHNDVLTREDADGFATGRVGGHLDLPRMREGGLAGGIFAVFTPTPGTGSVLAGASGEYAFPLADPVSHDVAAADAARAAGRLLRLEREGLVRVCRCPGELDAARAAGVPATVLH